jgi:hypothetical protein
VKTLHGGADLLPGEPRLSLSDPDKKQGKEAEEDVGGDPFILSVVERPQIEGDLERTKGTLHLLNLFVTQCHVFGRERIVADREDVLPVQMLLAVRLSCGRSSGRRSSVAIRSDPSRHATGACRRAWYVSVP